MGNDSNWPPLEISGCRVRAGYATRIQGSTFEVSMPAFKVESLNKGSGFPNLFARLNDQSSIPVLFSRAAPCRPEDVGKPAKMCGGRWADPEGYLARIACMDIHATPGERIDLEITFAIDQKLATCSYTREDPAVFTKVITWNDVDASAKRPDDGSLGEFSLRATPGLVTGFFSTEADLWTRGDTGHCYDLDEYGFQVWIADIKVK